MTVDMPACMTCIHFHREGPLSCDAFPERIPDVIWLEGNPHLTPVTGDHGIRYEPDPKFANSGDLKSD